MFFGSTFSGRAARCLRGPLGVVLDQLLSGVSEAEAVLHLFDRHLHETEAFVHRLQGLDLLLAPLEPFYHSVLIETSSVVYVHAQLDHGVFLLHLLHQAPQPPGITNQRI